MKSSGSKITEIFVLVDDGFNATMGNEVMDDDGSQLNVNGGLITVNMS